MNINTEILTHVLNKMLGKPVVRADYQTKKLHGGTLGDVQLVTGTAEISNGETLPYEVVFKLQKKWERHGDPDSWRREYDLYASDLCSTFSDTFRWPECYYAEISDNEIQLWMEYINGVSGLDLTGEMYERAAFELGRWQGKLYAKKPAPLRSLTNLSGIEYAKKFYMHYKSWNVVFDYIRSADCEIPKHLCQMLIDVDDHADEIFNRIERLPVVLCHRDFWVENIFYTDGSIVLIDWDTSGWGYIGEDIASLIADEADVANMDEYYGKCVAAYYKGLSEHMDVSHFTDHCIHELILVMYGYRLVEWYINADSPDGKALQIDTLQKIFEMRKSK